MVDFSLRVIETADRTVVTVRGELDIATCVELQRALEAALARPSDVVVELADVAFIDSTALQVVAAASAALERAGRRLVLAAPSAVVVRAITLCGVQELLTIQPDRPDDRAP